MTPLGKLAALGAGVGTAAAASAMWVALKGAPSSTAAQPSKPAKPAASTVVVCVGPDSMMRAVNAASCPSGQTPLNVDCTGCGKPNDGDTRHVKEELANLKRRLDALHKS